MSLFDSLTQAAEKESTGGGIVAKCNVQTGYKAFVQGLGNRDSFFPCDYTNDDSKKKAQVLAKAKCTNGERSSLSIQIQVYKDFVKGRDVTWQDDRFFCYPLWTNAAKKIVIPSLKTANVDTLGEMWLRIGFADDPDGRTKQNQNGETVIDKIAFIAEKFATEQAALAAVAGGDVQAENAKAPKSNSAVPIAYADQPDVWHSWIADVKKQVSGMPAPKLKAYIEKEYGGAKEKENGVTAAEILAALK